MALFERRGRYYHIQDRKLIRVTAVLDIINKPQLIPWAARSAAEIALSEPSLSIERVVSLVFQKKETAADLGSDIHEIISKINKKEEFDISSVPEKKRGYIAGFLNFCATVNPKTLLAEQECYSFKYGYAGTTDWIAEFPSKEVWLMDFKTGGIYLEAGLQMAAYKAAINEMIDSKILEIPKIDKTAVVQLNSDGTFNLRIFDSPIEIFLRALELFNWYESNK